MRTIDRGAEPAPEVIREDACEAFRIVRSGGVAILPLSVSYAIFSHSALGVERIYSLKNRPSSKPNGVLGNLDIFNQVMQTEPRDRELVECITIEHDLPLSVVAPFRADHPWLQSAQWGALRRSSKNGTMDLLLNAGTIHNELARLSWESGVPLFGSSANRSLTGSKFELHEVEESLRAGCEIVIGYGRSPHANRWAVGSTIIELPGWRVLRYGGCYEQQAAIVKARFGVDLPPRPTEGSMSLV